MKYVGVFVCLCMLAVVSAYSLGKPLSEVTPVHSKEMPTPTPDGQSPYNSYRGIAIRTPAAEVAEKLGTPTQKSKAGDYYLISPAESVQISYDSDQTVKAISVNYTGDLKTAPTPKDVVGMDVKKDEEGSINKMVSYPKEGFWISYIRTPGKDATIIITLQKTAIQ